MTAEPALRAERCAPVFASEDDVRAFVAEPTSFPADVEPWRRAQLSSFCPSACPIDQLGETEFLETWRMLWTLDLVDEATGTPRFQLYTWPIGAAALFAHGTPGPELGYAVQHGFRLAEPDDLLQTAIGFAYLETREQFGVLASIDF